MSTLPAYRITLSDGSSYVTSMAAHVTLADAREYFMGTHQVRENFETRKETVLRVVSVERVQK